MASVLDTGHPGDVPIGRSQGLVGSELPKAQQRHAQRPGHSAFWGNVWFGGGERDWGAKDGEDVTCEYLAFELNVFQPHDPFGCVVLRVMVYTCLFFFQALDSLGECYTLMTPTIEQHLLNNN